MRAELRRETQRERPLVAVVCSVPLLAEAVRSALEFAEVLPFAESGGDVGGLLQWLEPDAVVVDSEQAAAAAEAYASEHEMPLVHVAVRTQQLRLFRHGVWERAGDGEGATPESVRNVVAGALYAGGGAGA